MFASLCILGRQPKLGLAELESLYGSASIQPVSDSAALLNKVPAEVAFAFLGGTVKFCKVLTELDTVNWQSVQKFLLTAVPQHASSLPNGKLRLGLSVYGLTVSPRQITGTALEVKKTLRKDNRAVRVVPNKEVALNSAQVLHNQLTSELGWELVFVKNGSKTIVAQTIAEQDIEAYTKRDRGRPKRDARVGMLPPKLAQIIINLASAEALVPGCGPAKPMDKVILDPFCGTGVVLQESILMGYRALGTDLEPRMVDYSRANLKWLGFFDKNWQVEVGDATDYQWPKFDIVACETYLGQPFSAIPRPEKLEQVMQDVNTITRKFLKNLATQTKPGFRACIAVPAWLHPSHRSSLLTSKARNSAGASGARDHFSAPMLSRGSASTASSASRGQKGSDIQMRDVKFLHLPLLDSLEELGYTRVSFVHAEDKDLVYHREGQVVGRELVVLQRT